MGLTEEKAGMTLWRGVNEEKRRRGGSSLYHHQCRRATAKNEKEKENVYGMKNKNMYRASFSSKRRRSAGKGKAGMATKTASHHLNNNGSTKASDGSWVFSSIKQTKT